MNKLLIGITGQAGAGKDTIGTILQEEHGFYPIAFAEPMKHFARLVFGFTHQQVYGPIEVKNAFDPRFEGPDGQNEKYVCAIRFGMFADRWLRDLGVFNEDPDELYEAERSLQNWLLSILELHRISPRIVLQTLGTEWGRKTKDGLWIEVGLGRVERLFRAQGVLGVVITDLRFVDEAKAVRFAGGQVWRVIRPGYHGDVGISGHASEREIHGSDMDLELTEEIVNSGSLEDLALIVKQAFRSSQQRMSGA